MALNIRTAIKEEIAGTTEEILEKHFDQLRHELQKLLDELALYIDRYDPNEETELVSTRDKLASLIDVIY